MSLNPPCSSHRWPGGSSLSLLLCLLGALPSASLTAQVRADVESSQPAPPELALQNPGEKVAAAHAHYVSARLLENEGRMREALGHYLAFVKTGAASPELVAHVATLALDYQGMEAALKLLEDAMQASPASPQPFINFTRFALTQATPENGLLAKAATAVEQALTRFPQQAGAYENAARFYLSQNDRPKAAEVLERAAKQPSTDTDYWLGLGRVAQEVWPLSEGDVRADHLAHVNVFFDKAMLRARESANDDAELHIADYYLFSNQLDRAATICEGMVQRNGSLDARKRLVRLYDALERADDSLTALEGLVQAYPLDVEHRRLLASKYNQRRATSHGEERLTLAKKSAAQYEAALQAGGGDMDDYIRTAELIRETGDFERLDRFTARAQQLFPSEPVLGYFRGVALNLVEKHAESASMFERTAKLAETRAPELLNDSRYHFAWGIALERSGQFDAAAKAFEKSVDLTPADNPPSSASTLNYWGYMWIEQNKNLDKAEILIRKANELRPDEPAFIDSLGWLFFKQGKVNEALAELERAEKLMETFTPEDAEILDHIAQVHQKLGHADKAREYWRRALDLNPPQEAIRKRAEKELGLEKTPPSSKPPVTPEEKPTTPPPAAPITPKPAQTVP